MQRSRMASGAANVKFSEDQIWNPAQPRDGGIRDRVVQVQHEAERKIDTQRDGRGRQAIATDHPAAVTRGVAANNCIERHGGRAKPSKRKQEKAPGRDAAGLRMPRQRQHCNRADQNCAAIDPAHAPVIRPVALTKRRQKLQRPGEQRNATGERMHREQVAMVEEVIQRCGKGNYRKRIPQSAESIRNRKQAEQDPADFGCDFHLSLRRDAGPPLSAALHRQVR